MPKSNFDGLSVLVLEDEVLMRKQISAGLERIGMDVNGATNLAGARQLASEMSFDFALIDVNLPDGNSMELLREGVFPESTGVVVMTGDTELEGAVEAMRLGALDYLSKPFDVGELPLVFARAKKARQTARAEAHKRVESGDGGIFFGDSLTGVKQRLEKIIAADKRLGTELPPVLIIGETGTGKTTIARWLHNNGPRAGQELIDVNCSALPETLAESELFGHEKGAFTDARSGRMGLFEAASGGTLFLDELPSLSPGLQAKVLKVLEDGRIRRVGGNKEIQIDTRVIAATNVDLKEAIAAGAFREDLYHRLDLYRIQIPPLRERGEDVARLAEVYVERLCARHRLPVKTITAKGRERILAHEWKGNVRELAHELERAIVFEDEAELDFGHLIGGGSMAGSDDPGDWLKAGFQYPEEGFQLEEAINRLIRLALRQKNENVSAAARLLGVSRDYIRYRLSGKKKD
ncbi:MAG: DNA-binding NtrC family response regulator [Limisphaerales bacterium]|jgi:DNA-binding NtrC family response regulator